MTNMTPDDKAEPFDELPRFMRDLSLVEAQEIWSNASLDISSIKGTPNGEHCICVLRCRRALC
jgi:hypothetical protein